MPTEPDDPCPTCGGEMFVIPAHCRCFGCWTTCADCYLDPPIVATHHRPSSLSGGPVRRLPQEAPEWTIRQGATPADR